MHSVFGSILLLQYGLFPTRWKQSIIITSWSITFVNLIRYEFNYDNRTFNHELAFNSLRFVLKGDNIKIIRNEISKIGRQLLLHFLFPIKADAQSTCIKNFRLQMWKKMKLQFSIRSIRVDCLYIQATITATSVVTQFVTHTCRLGLHSAVHYQFSAVNIFS